MCRLARLIVTSFLLPAFSLTDAIAAEFKPVTSLSVNRNIGSDITWQITASQEDAGKNYPQLPARICFSNRPKAVRQCEPAQGVEVIGNLEVVRFLDAGEPSSGVLLTTNTYAMGGGPRYLGLWVYEKARKHFRNILPAGLYVPAMGVHKFLPSHQKKSVLIIAGPDRLIDYNAAPDDPGRETIWSPHHYIIDIYSYQPERGFFKTRSFRTKKKYDPEGDAERLIDSELSRIKALL